MRRPGTDDLSARQLHDPDNPTLGHLPIGQQHLPAIRQRPQCRDAVGEPGADLPLLT